MKTIREAFKKMLHLWACSYLEGGGGFTSQRPHLLFACSKPTFLALGSPKTNFVFTPTSIFNRPSVAGAVLQSPLLLTHWAILWFKYLPNTVNHKPEELDRRFIPYYVSCVMCHMSHVTCHVSHITSKFFFHLKKKLSLKIIGPSGGTSWWRVCYQRGLPRLVYIFPDLFDHLYQASHLYLL